MLEVDKLYLCEDWYLFLYPDLETAADAERAYQGAAAAVGRPRHRRVAAWIASTPHGVAYYSEKFGKSISFIDKNVVFLVLNNMENKYYEVLAGDKKGWIICREWLNAKEVEYGTS